MASRQRGSLWEAAAGTTPWFSALDVSRARGRLTHRNLGAHEGDAWQEAEERVELCEMVVVARTALDRRVHSHFGHFTPFHHLCSD